MTDTPTSIERLDALETACAEVITWTPRAIVALPHAELAWFVQANLPAIITALRQPTPDAIIERCAAIAEQYQHAWGEGNNPICGLIAADIRALEDNAHDK